MISFMYFSVALARFIKIRDTVSFRATANRVKFSLSLHIGEHTYSF